MQYLPMILTLGTLFTLAVVGCQKPVTPIITHKLVAIGNQHAVPVYPDEQTYLHTSREKQEGGVVGVVGDVKQQLTAKQIDDQTPVQIVTTDDYRRSGYRDRWTDEGSDRIRREAKRRLVAAVPAAFQRRKNPTTPS